MQAMSLWLDVMTDDQTVLRQAYSKVVAHLSDVEQELGGVRQELCKVKEERSKVCKLLLSNQMLHLRFVLCLDSFNAHQQQHSPFL